MKTDTIKSLPQGTLIWPREAVEMKTNGRTMKVLPGQSFWVQNTSLSQQISGTAQIARSNSKCGFGVMIDDLHKYFTTGEPQDSSGSSVTLSVK